MIGRKARLLVQSAIMAGVAISQSVIAADLQVCLNKCSKAEMTELDARDCLRFCEGLKGEAVVAALCRANSRIIELDVGRINASSDLPGIKYIKITAKRKELEALAAKSNCDNKLIITKVDKILVTWAPPKIPVIAADVRQCVNKCYNKEINTEREARDCLLLCKGLKGEKADVGLCRANSRIVELEVGRINASSDLPEIKYIKITAKREDLEALAAKSNCDNKLIITKVDKILVTWAPPKIPVIAADVRQCVNKCYNIEINTEREARDCLMLCKGLKGEKANVGLCRANSRIIELDVVRINASSDLPGIKDIKITAKRKELETLAAKSNCDNKLIITKVDKILVTWAPPKLRPKPTGLGGQPLPPPPQDLGLPPPPQQDLGLPPPPQQDLGQPLPPQDLGLPPPPIAVAFTAPPAGCNVNPNTAIPDVIKMEGKFKKTTQFAPVHPGKMTFLYKDENPKIQGMLDGKLGYRILVADNVGLRGSADKADTSGDAEVEVYVGDDKQFAQFKNKVVCVVSKKKLEEQQEQKAESEEKEKQLEEEQQKEKEKKAAAEEFFKFCENKIVGDNHVEVKGDIIDVLQRHYFVPNDTEMSKLPKKSTGGYKGASKFLHPKKAENVDGYDLSGRIGTWGSKVDYSPDPGTDVTVIINKATGDVVCVEADDDWG